MGEGIKLPSINSERITMSKMKKINGMTFDAWFNAVDKEVDKILDAGYVHEIDAELYDFITEAISVNDLADCCFRDMWRDEVTPRDGAWEALSRDTMGQMLIAGEDI